MQPKEVGPICKTIQEEIEKIIVGKPHVVKNLIVTLLADGHVLFEDLPGLAKTLMISTMAEAVGCDFKRIQFTPDLLPADVTGTQIFNQKTTEFELRKGPAFTMLLLADEINRAPPKTQSALLEAMQERQITIDGVMHKLPKPFSVCATMNPIEYEGTFALPEAQLDRFLVKLSIGYPTVEDEIEIVRRRIERKSDFANVSKVIDADKVVAMQLAIEDVVIDPLIREYIVKLVYSSRTHPKVEVGASPRGSLALVKLSRAHAAYHGRDYVVPDDVKAVSIMALAHRLIIKTADFLSGTRSTTVISELLESVEAPRKKETFVSEDTQTQ